MKMFSFFVSLISESEACRWFIAHRVKYFKPLFLEMVVIVANENPKSIASENQNTVEKFSFRTNLIS